MALSYENAKRGYNGARRWRRAIRSGATQLIAQIEASGPRDEMWVSKVKVLSEMIEHHVEEEEDEDGGMFAQAREQDLDLQALGRQLKARQEELLREMRQ